MSAESREGFLAAVRRLVQSIPATAWSEERWFAGKGLEIEHVTLVDGFVLGEGPTVGAIVIVEVSYRSGETHRYQLPVAASATDYRDLLRGPDAGDAFWSALLEGFRERRSIAGDDGSLVFCRPEGSSPLPGAWESCRPLGVDQSNSSTVLDERLVLKSYRRVEDEPNPEVELCEALSRGASFPHVPRVEGWIECRTQHGPRSLALLQEFLPAAVDGWSYALELLKAGEPGRGWLELVVELAELTANLHLALASSERPELVPEDVDDGDPRGTGATASQGRRIRIHGDYHLGQVVRSSGRLFVVDFEGEPARPVAERRKKHSPLKDVAGMLRSFHYALCTVHGVACGNDDDLQDSLATACGAFLERYFKRIDAERAELIPPEPLRSHLVERYQLEKAEYELCYELANRPEMAEIPRSWIDRRNADLS